MEIDDQLFKEVTDFVGAHPAAEVYALYTKLLMAKVKNSKPIAASQNTEDK